MRFIIREQEYEKPLAAGLFHFTMDDTPTGTTEEWRLSESAGEYLFLRIDVDARRSNQRDSTLYHLALNPAWQAQRLKFRYFRKDFDLNGDVLFDEDGVTLSRFVKGGRFEQSYDYAQVTPVASVTGATAFWFATILGTTLLVRSFDLEVSVRHASSLKLTGPSLSEDSLSPDAFVLLAQEVSLDAGQQQGVNIGRDTVAARPLSISAQGQERRIWLDESRRLPVRMEYANGLVATETRYIRY